MTAVFKSLLAGLRFVPHKHSGFNLIRDFQRQVVICLSSFFGSTHHSKLLSNALENSVSHRFGLFVIGADEAKKLDEQSFENSRPDERLIKKFIIDNLIVHISTSTNEIFGGYQLLCQQPMVPFPAHQFKRIPGSQADGVGKKKFKGTVGPDVSLLPGSKLVRVP